MPPGGKPTTSRTGLVGQAGAWACAAMPHSSVQATRARERIEKDIVCARRVGKKNGKRQRTKCGGICASTLTHTLFTCVYSRIASKPISRP
ncbi:hypothetical protein D9M72_657150 [compost metagenome]